MEYANCKLEYEDSLGIKLAKEMVAYVESLVSDPVTHYLHREARKDMLTRLSDIAEQARTVQQEITLLLSLWEVRISDIVRRWEGRENVDERDKTIIHMKEQDSLLSTLATTQLSQGKKKRALKTWEQLLVTRKTLKSIIGDKNKDGDSNGDDDDNCDIGSDIEVVAREIRSIKEIMGLIERSDEYSAHLRDDIAKLLRKNNLLLSTNATWEMSCYGTKNHQNMKRRLAFSKRQVKVWNGS